MIKRKLLVPAAAISFILALAGCTGEDNKEKALNSKSSAHPISSPKDDVSTQTITSSLEDLMFRAERNSAGDLVARPIGLPENNYSLSGGPAVELQGKNITPYISFSETITQSTH